MLSCNRCNRSKVRRQDEIEQTLGKLGGVEATRVLLEEYLSLQEPRGQLLMLDGATHDMVAETMEILGPVWKEHDANIHVMPAGHLPTWAETTEMLSQGKHVLLHSLGDNTEMQLSQTLAPIRVFIYASPAEIAMASQTPQEFLERLQSFSERVEGSVQETSDYTIRRQDVRNLLSHLQDAMPGVPLNELSDQLTVALDLHQHEVSYAHPVGDYDIVVPIQLLPQLHTLLAEHLDGSDARKKKKGGKGGKGRRGGKKSKKSSGKKSSGKKHNKPQKGGKKKGKKGGWFSNLTKKISSGVKEAATLAKKVSSSKIAKDLVTSTSEVLSKYGHSKLGDTLKKGLSTAENLSTKADTFLNGPASAPPAPEPAPAPAAAAAAAGAAEAVAATPDSTAAPAAAPPVVTAKQQAETVSAADATAAVPAVTAAQAEEQPAAPAVVAA